MQNAHVLRSAARFGRLHVLAQRLLALGDCLVRSDRGSAEHSLPPQGQAADRASVHGSASHVDAPQPDVETRFRELHPRVYAYIRYRIADLQEAEDLTSEIMERALVRLNTYDVRKGAFSTWLFRIAHNMFVNYTKQQRLQRRYAVDLGEGLEDLATEEPSPEQAAVRKEQIERLLVCVRTLPLRQQEILSMRFAGRLTNREIAGVLHMNERTVSVVIFRALRTLRRKLAE